MFGHERRDLEEIDGHGASGRQVRLQLSVWPRLISSNPHPFVSLLNPIKGQKLFFRLQRHLQPQQAITLLTLLTATYPQLDVVTRAPPPPVADASILTKVERKERAKREAETDNFLQFVVPGLDRIITEQCGLSLINGLFGICFQRMEVWRVASTRVCYQLSVMFGS
jgi:DNA topoisomerase 2-associated protein PAT1